MNKKKISCCNPDCKKDIEYSKEEIIWAEMPQVNVVQCKNCAWYTTVSVPGKTRTDDF